MGHQFVMGRTIEEALERSVSGENRAYRYSFDMLGEAALTRRGCQALSRELSPGDRARWRARSKRARRSRLRRAFRSSCRRCSRATSSRSGDACSPSSRRACTSWRSRRATAASRLRVDAEEAERLELSLELIERVVRSPQLKGWNGFGLAVQAYQKRTREVIRWLRELAELDQRAAQRAAREGRVLGQRDQAGAGARACRLSGVHAQGQHRRVVPRVRARADRRGCEHLSAVRDSQRAHRRDHRRGVRRRPSDRSSSSACMAWARSCMRSRRRGQARPAVPRVCAGRLARRSAAVPGAPPAGERRQYVVRESHRRRADGHRRHRPRSGRRGGRAAAEVRIRAFRCRGCCMARRG